MRKTIFIATSNQFLSINNVFTVISYPLSDLKNAFGKVVHELVTYASKFRHVPDHII